MDTEKTTFALFFGNRGFFPASLQASARKEMTEVLSKLGHKTIALDHAATRHGAVETPEEGEKYANFLQQNRGKYGGVILCLPNFGDETGAVSALKERLSDEVADTRIAAAEALCVMGEEKTGLPILMNELDNENKMVALHALNSLDGIGDRARPALEKLRPLTRSRDYYTRSLSTYLVDKLTGEYRKKLMAERQG